MTVDAYKHIFGPVLSRRLGRSLGVDLMPFKTCTYDCVYCEQGLTTNHTAHRAAYVPTDEVLAELKDFLATAPAPDYITLSGAGEPTLHADLGEIVACVKSLTRVPLAVITNGSLLWDAPVQDALRAADVVLPSLDAGNAHMFAAVNRPVTGISFEQMVNGLIAFRASFRNEIWLEVLLMAGLTSAMAEVIEIAALVRRIRPDRVQLNTVVRPPAELTARPIARDQLESLAALFEPHAEIIADYSGPLQECSAAPETARLLELVERRPCSLQELAATLGLRQVEASKLVAQLLRRNRIQEKRFGGDVYFAAAHADNEETAR